MFFVSDLSVKSGKTYIPICCYLPYHCWSIDDSTAMTLGYFTADDGVTPNSITILMFDSNGGKILNQTNSTQYSCYCRLVRPLTIDELEDYKTNYLGYGSQPHRLTICHPDTYGSEGWISK